MRRLVCGDKVCLPEIRREHSLHGKQWTVGMRRRQTGESSPPGVTFFIFVSLTVCGDNNLETVCIIILPSTGSVRHLPQTLLLLAVCSVKIGDDLQNRQVHGCR